MILDDGQIKLLLIKYEEDTIFNNEIVLTDVINLKETIVYWKHQAEHYKKTSPFYNKP